MKDIIYKETQQQILQAVMPDGKVPMVCSPVFFGDILVSELSERLKQTRVKKDTESCISERKSSQEMFCVPACISAGVGSSLLQQLVLREVTANPRHSSSGRLHLPGPGLRSSAPPGDLCLSGHVETTTSSQREMSLVERNNSIYSSQAGLR